MTCGGVIAAVSAEGAVLMETVVTKVTNAVKINDLVRTIESVRDQPELGKFRFSISNRWLGGGHTRSEVNSFTAHPRSFGECVSSTGPMRGEAIHLGTSV